MTMASQLTETNEAKRLEWPKTYGARVSEDWATVNFSDTSMFDVDVLDVFGQHWDDMPGEH